MFTPFAKHDQRQRTAAGVPCRALWKKQTSMRCGLDIRVMDRLVQETEHIPWADQVRAEGTKSSRERAIVGSLREQEASPGTGRTCPGRERQVGS